MTAEAHMRHIQDAGVKNITLISQHKKTTNRYKGGRPVWGRIPKCPKKGEIYGILQPHIWFPWCIAATICIDCVKSHETGERIGHMRHRTRHAGSLGYSGTGQCERVWPECTRIDNKRKLVFENRFRGRRTGDYTPFTQCHNNKLCMLPLDSRT